MDKKQESESHHGFYDVLDYIRELPNLTEPYSTEDLVILGKTYKVIQPTIETRGLLEETTHTNNSTFPSAEDEQQVIITGSTQDNSKTAQQEQETEPVTPLHNIRAFFSKLSNSAPSITDIAKSTTVQLPNSAIKLPEEFSEDLYTRLWFTYRYGFPIIERDKNGPSPVSLGSFLRGTLDMQNMGKGFTSDSGWGCMIRTSQSLLANAFISLKLGRDWRLTNSSEEDIEIHWNIVEQFADIAEANYSIQNYVLYAAKYCGKRPGEWFGPSNAAKSIQKLCEEKSGQNLENNLKVYISTDSGDIFDDEILKLSKDDNLEAFTPILILCGVRLGVQTINPVYWDFLKFLLNLPYSVGIAGGRPSSSHYFFGYQSDSLFYLDPHVPQSAILLDETGHINANERQRIMESIHSEKLRKIHIGKIDPSMLIGFLIKSKAEYDAFKESVDTFENTKRFLNIYDSRPPPIKSLGSTDSELDGFIDLGFDSNDEEPNAVPTDELNVSSAEIYKYDKLVNPESEYSDEKIENIDELASKAPPNMEQDDPVKVDNNLVVDAFDLDCDPSQNYKVKNTEEPENEDTADDSLVVVSAQGMQVAKDMVLVESSNAEEH